MTLGEAWRKYSDLLHKLDPANDLGHLCKDLRASGWIVEVKIKIIEAPFFPVTASTEGVICSLCGQLIPGGGCKPCPECGTMSGGCS